MTLTKQIISEVVKDAVKSEIQPFRQDFNEFKSETKSEFAKINKKLSTIEDTIDKFAGQVKTFGTEQVLQSGRISSNTDRIENIELKVFESIQMA